MRRKLVALILALGVVSLTGCVSHCFLDTVSRLQIENGTEDFTLYALDVLSVDGSTYEKWIDETVEPGGRSHVVEADWVGEFHVRVRYGRDGGDTLQDVRKMDIDGGSMYLKITALDDSLVYKFK